MYKLLFSLIILSIGFSTIAEAQNVNNSKAFETLTYHKSKHFSVINTKENVLESKAINNVVHNKNKASTSSLQFYRVPEKTAVENTAQSHVTSHKKTNPNNKITNLKIAHINKVRDSMKVEKQGIEN